MLITDSYSKLNFIAYSSQQLYKALEALVAMETNMKNNTVIQLEEELEKVPLNAAQLTKCLSAKMRRNTGKLWSGTLQHRMRGKERPNSPEMTSVDSFSVLKFEDETDKREIVIDTGCSNTSRT